ncbi:MAG TPA: copper uptake system-associated protein [Rhizobiaceae bacterium]|nr:copper uptake system-associated protein [Rhizobiaceae bacterium]
MKHGALDDKGEIERVLKAQFETPANRLTVEPVTVRGDWAVAGWMQDGRGGRGLLKRGMHGWSVHMCSGESLRQAAALSSAGLAQADAEALAAAVNDAEKALAADRIALLDSFDGTIMIGEGQAHGHAHN